MVFFMGAFVIDAAYIKALGQGPYSLQSTLGQKVAECEIEILNSYGLISTSMDQT
jgi:hypothetical protein